MSLQTAMAHNFGLASQTRTSEELPRIKAPVFMRDDNDVITPYRMMWPSFWGWLDGEEVTPIQPADAYKVLRRALRIRKDFQSEVANITLTKDQRIEALGEEAGAKPVSELTEDEQATLTAYEEVKVVEVFREKLVDALKGIGDTAADGSTAQPVFIS